MKHVRKLIGEREFDDANLFFNEGVKCGKDGIGIDENSVEANFWLAVNYGAFGQEKGIMQSLALVTPIKDLAKKVIELDAAYFYGGAYRVLSQLLSIPNCFRFKNGLQIS